MFCAFLGTAQTLTSAFTFTASGSIGTPATAATPFQGKTFANANITISAVGNTINRVYESSTYCVTNDATSVTI